MDYDCVHENFDCPACGKKQDPPEEVVFDQGKQEEYQCSECGDRFLISYDLVHDWYARKASCLNDEKHKWERVHTDKFIKEHVGHYLSSPEEVKKSCASWAMYHRCVLCEKEKNLTQEEIETLKKRKQKRSKVNEMSYKMPALRE